MNSTDRRKHRVRYALKAKANGKPRLSVFRSNKHIYAQVIDDINGVTLASASTLKSPLSVKGNITAAEYVGKEIAKFAIAANVSAVVFDRGGNIYHGRVKAVAEAARAEGLKF